MSNISKLSEAYDLIKNYNGNNPYLLILKKNCLINKHSLNDFEIEFIIKNHNLEPMVINKITKVPDWYGEKKKTEWNLEFIPSVIKIITYLGETDSVYCCYIQYRQSVSPIMCFIPKKAVLNNFLVQDYHEIDVDFERYDRLAAIKDPNRKVMHHQKEAVQFLLSRKHCILADDMGLGKSNELSIASIEGNFDSVLIICPASLKSNWKNELLWYVDEHDITIVDSFNDKTKPELEKFLGYAEGKSNKKRDELLLEAKEQGKWQNNRFVIINYDILEEFYEIPKSRSKENVQKAFENSPMLQYLANKKSLIIIDEAHRLSNNTSTRYKVIKDLIKRSEPHSLYLATGTPITNNPKNLFCLLQLLKDPIKDDWEFYMNRYCGARKFVHPKDKGKREWISQQFIKNCGKRNWYDLTQAEKNALQDKINKSCRMMTVADGATHLDELKERISHIYLRRIKEDEVSKLPQKFIHENFYSLTYPQRMEYDRLWIEYEAQKQEEDPDKELNKDLLEGGIYRRYLSTQMTEHTKKLCDSLVEKGEKVVIFCCYDEELYTLKEYYGENAVIYNGKLNIKQKDNAMNEFKNNPDVKVFIGNITAAGVGINLTNSCYLIFNNMSFVPGDNQQAMDRVYRIGQNRDCHIFYQMFSDTQYEKMWNTVLRKSYVINSIIKKEDEK